MQRTPSWQECFAIAFICTLGCEKLRELFSSEPVGVVQKIAVWSWNLWNPCDMVAVFIFLIGLTLRFREDTFEEGRVIYCSTCIYWYLRILNILSVNKYLGRQNSCMKCYLVSESQWYLKVSNSIRDLFQIILMNISLKSLLIFQFFSAPMIVSKDPKNRMIRWWNLGFHRKSLHFFSNSKFQIEQTWPLNKLFINHRWST